MRNVIVVAALLASSVSHADEFGGFKFTAPGGTREVVEGHVSFTKITGKTFCQFALFTARPATGGDEDAADEWRTVVEKNFEATDVAPPRTGKTRSLEYIAVSATMSQKDKGSFAGTLYIVGTGAAISSLLVTSTSKATLEKCPTKKFLDSLELVTVPPGQAAPAAPAAGPAPAANTAAQPAESIVGTWGGGSSSSTHQYGMGSTSKRTYTFNADGTYAYFSETYNGINEWIHVRESGKYTITGNQLTIAPTASTISSRDWKKVNSSKKNTLEKVTYAFQKHFFSGLQEWNLVLTPPKQTQRDGAFASNPQFPSSYLLTQSYKVEFKWP